MEKKFSKTAYTLIELIVSLALVSIIVLGIFSINMVLNNNNQDYGQRYLVKSETQATLNHILNNASLAVGSKTFITLSDNSTVLDKGILIGTADLGNGDPVNNPNTFCIHQSADSNVTGTTLANDIWLCYTWFNTYQIQYCNMPYTLDLYRGAVSCAGNPTSQFLGTAYSISNLNGNLSPPLFNSVAGFSMTIQNCLNDSDPPGTCSSSGISADPVNNPEVQLSGSVYPPQEGM